MGYRSEVLADSPHFYWRFEEASGAILDETANAINGTKVGTVTQGVAGKVGSAIQIGTGSSTNYVTTGSTVNFADVFTIEAWVKRNSTSAASRGIFSGTIGHPGVFLNASGNVVLRKRGTADIVTSTIAITDTNLHHVVVTKNGSTVNIYVDGVDRTGTVTNQTMASATTTPSFGTAEASSGTFVDADAIIDEAAFYKTELSAARVQAHYVAAFETVSTRMVGGVGV